MTWRGLYGLAEAGGEVEVVAWRSHGHHIRATSNANLERLFNCQHIF